MSIIFFIFSISILILCVSAIAEKCKQISFLDISKCHSISDTGVTAIAEKLGPSALIKLNLFGLTKISNNSLMSISGKHNII